MYIIKGNTIDEELTLLMEAINILTNKGFEIKSKYKIYSSRIFVVLYGGYNDNFYQKKIVNKMSSYRNNLNGHYLQDKQTNMNTSLRKLESKCNTLISFNIIPFNASKNKNIPKNNFDKINKFIKIQELKDNPINLRQIYIIFINLNSNHYITFDETKYTYDYLIKSVNSIIIDQGDYFNFPKGLTYQVNYPTLTQLKIFSNWFQVREESTYCNQHNYEYYKLYTTKIDILNIYKYIFRKYNPRLTLQKDQYTIYNNKYKYTVLLQKKHSIIYSRNSPNIDNIYNISIFSQKIYVDLETNIKNLFSCVENPKKNKYRLRCFITNLPICYDNSKYIYLICMECEVNGLHYIKYICVHPFIILYSIRAPEISQQDRYPYKKYLQVMINKTMKICIHSMKRLRYKIDCKDEINYKYLEKNTYSIYSILNKLPIPIYKTKLYCHCITRIESIKNKLYDVYYSDKYIYYSYDNVYLNGKKVIYTNLLTDSFVMKQIYTHGFRPIIFVVIKSE
jgi:hypothetical protein